MKILLAAHHSPPNFMGGVEWVTLHGAQWLKSHGHQVEIASVEEIRSNPDGDVFSQVEEYQGIRIHRLSIPASSPSMRFQESFWKRSNRLRCVIPKPTTRAGRNCCRFANS